MDWNKEFAYRNSNETLNVLTSCILNVFQNFCPSKNIIFNAPWMTNKIKSLLNQKTKLYEQYIKNGLKGDDKAKLDDITAHASKLISETKENYLVNQSNKRSLDRNKKVLVYFEKNFKEENIYDSINFFQ